MEMLPDALKNGEKAKKEMESGQVRLFDEPEAEVQPGDRPEFPESQLLAFEKEVLGTYVSSHPLTRYEKLLKNVAVPIKDLLEKAPDEHAMVITGGVVQKLKSKVTGKDQERLNFYLEDLEAEIWVFVNEKLTKEKREFFGDNRMLMARGRLSYFEDRPVIHLESVIGMDEAYEKLGKFLHIRVRELGMEEITMKEINNTLAAGRGSGTAVIMHVITKDQKELVLTLDQENNVTVSEELLRKLEAIVGEDNMWLTWKK
jgi:DNA polymerase-3 subunit alpha